MSDSIDFNDMINLNRYFIINIQEHLWYIVTKGRKQDDS